MTKTGLPKIISMLAMASALSGCVTPFEATRQASLTAIELNSSTAGSLIDTSPQIDLKERVMESNTQYLDHVYYSIAHQMATLATSGQYYKLPITFTDKMYNSDKQGFYVVLDSRWLKSVGAIGGIYPAVLSTNNAWNSQTSKVMSLATYNRTILNGIAVSNISNSSLTNKQRHLLTAPYLAGEYELYTHKATKTKFVASKEENLDYLELFLSLDTKIAGGRFVPSDYFGVNPRETKRAVFFVKASIDEAKAMIGHTGEVYFLPIAAFRVSKTGQEVVLASSTHSAIKAPRREKLQGDLAAYYSWDGQSFEEKFTQRRSIPWVVSDKQDGPMCNEDCKTR